MTTIRMTKENFDRLYNNTITTLTKKEWQKKLNIKFIKVGVKNA